MGANRRPWVQFLIVVLAVPTAWAAENVARVLFLSEQSALLAELFGETLRRIAWICFGLTVVLGLAAASLRGPLRRRYDPGGAMMGGASIAQIPAILACSIGLLGADPLPVGLTVAIATVFVAWHWPARASGGA